MRIVSFTKLPGLQDAVRATAPDAQFTLLSSSQTLPPDLDAEVLFASVQLPPGFLERLIPTLKSLRWIHLMGTGIDKFPMHVLGDRLLTVARGISATPIAEWVMASVLAQVKGVPGNWLHAAPARWNFPNQPIGVAAGQHIAIAGYGEIGRAVAKRALAFDMHVSAMRRQQRPDAEFPQVRMVGDWASLVADADHVVLTMPLTPETTGYLDAARLSTLKRGVHLVNVARGKLVDTDALRAALDSGQIGFATLDVIDPEPLPQGHWAYAHPQVHISAHVSWGTRDAFGDYREFFIANLRRYVNGATLQGLVNRDAGY